MDAFERVLAPAKMIGIEIELLQMKIFPRHGGTQECCRIGRRQNLRMLFDDDSQRARIPGGGEPHEIGGEAGQ